MRRFIFAVLFSLVFLLTSCGQTGVFVPEDVERVIVSPYANRDMTFEYTSEEKIGVITDLIKSLSNLSQTEENPLDYNGASYVIYLITEDQSRYTYVESGGRFFKEGENPWCEIPEDKASRFEEIFKEYEPDIPAEKNLFE